MEDILQRPISEEQRTSISTHGACILLLAPINPHHPTFLGLLTSLLRVINAIIDYTSFTFTCFRSYDHLQVRFPVYQHAPSPSLKLHFPPSLQRTMPPPAFGNPSLPRPLLSRPSLPHPSISHPFRIPTTQWRIQSPATRERASVSMNSVKTPDFFSTKWYHAPPLEIEQSSHHISNHDTRTDYHFVNSERGLMALVDYPSNSQSSSPAPHMLEYIEKRLQQTTQYSHEPVIDLRAVLASAIHVFGAPPGFSALIIHTTANIVRAAWVGACGFILVRDDAIVYRSYGEQMGKDALEHLLTDAPEEYLPDHQPSGGYTPIHIPSRRPPTCVDVASIQSDYLEVQDNDLVIGGSDGFFSNVSEKQVMAFVRPVQDLEDPTLAIANNTCLGSWRYDDVHFISYYLAIIATNFATATNSRPHLPFPFPPSPHLDDVTVLCASCTFVG